MGPQYFQNPFYDWDTFTGMMSNAARALPMAGPIGAAVGYFANQPQQGGMPQQQRPPMQNPMQQDMQDMSAGFRSATSIDPSLGAYRHPANMYVQDMNRSRYFGTQQDFTPAMPYVDYDPRYMDPMGPLGNAYYQQPRTPYAIDRAVSGFESDLPMINPYGTRTTQAPRDVEKL